MLEPAAVVSALASAAALAAIYALREKMLEQENSHRMMPVPVPVEDESASEG